MKNIYFILFCAVLIEQSIEVELERTYHHQNYRQLLKTDQCNYSCKFCEQSTPQKCSECDSTMNRILQGDQCVCKENYLEINEARCVACPQNCQKCSSASKCIDCFNNMYKYDNLCYSQCPQNTYQIPNTFTCVDYLQYNIKQKRDNLNRIVLVFKFNYSLKTTQNPTSLIKLRIQEDPTFTVSSIIHQTSTSNDELCFLILSKNSVGPTTLLIMEYSKNELISQQSSIPIQQVDSNNPIKIKLGAYIKPSKPEQLDKIRVASDFLYDTDEYSYDIFYVLRCFAIFIHIFPAIQFIMALCYMQVFRTPLFYYLIKFIGGFGLNKLPDWQIQEDEGFKEKFGDDMMPFLYYIIQLASIYLIYCIFKYIYERYQKQEVDHISKFEIILKIHIWSITILQYIHQVLLFYLVYYSIYILMQNKLSSSKDIVFFVLAILVIFYIVIYLIIGAYRLSINSFHFFINYIKEINEQSLYSRFYLFGVGNGRKIIFVVLICTFFNQNSLIISILSLIIYLAGCVYTIIIRPYESISFLMIKIIEELSQVGLFATILAGQAIYNSEDNYVLKNVDAYKNIDYACLGFLGVYLFMNTLKQLTSLKHFIFKNESTKRTIAHMHKFDDHYQDPISLSRNQALLDKSQFDSINNIGNFSHTNNKYFMSLQKKNMQQTKSANKERNQNNESYDGNESQTNSREKPQIEMNNLKSGGQQTNQSQKITLHKVNTTQNNQENNEDRQKFQNIIKQTKLKNQIFNQYQSSHNSINNNYQTNPISQQYNSGSHQRNMQFQNQLKKTDNGYMLQYTLRDLYGSQNMFSNHGNQYNSRYKSQGVPTIGMIMEQRKMQQNAEQVDNYFSKLYKNQQYQSNIPQNNQTNKFSNYESIEKNNFQSIQQNHGNNNYVINNPYLQNNQRLNKNLEYIQEEELQKGSNTQTPLTQSKATKKTQNQNQQFREQDSYLQNQDITNNQHRQFNSEDEDEDDHDYHQIDKEPTQNPQINGGKNNQNNNFALNDSYNEGESIDLQDLQRQFKERELKQILQQQIKSKTLEEKSVNGKQTNKQSKNQNQDETFKAFFHNNLKDNSIQYIQEDSDQNISNQSSYQQNQQDKLRKNQKQQVFYEQKLNGSNVISNRQGDISSIDNYVSPDFIQLSKQSQQHVQHNKSKQYNNNQQSVEYDYE